MRKFLLQLSLSAFGIASSASLLAQPAIQWDVSFGGDDNSNLRSLQQTNDGGFIAGGFSNSSAIGDKTENHRGNTNYPDYWIIKTLPDGTKVWDRTIGTNGVEEFSIVKQTADGGYILGGYGTSELNLGAANGNRSEDLKGTSSFWVVKVTSNGSIAWDRTLGGNNESQLTTLTQTLDGGYLLGGRSTSNTASDKSENSKGLNDYWIVKLDAAGNLEWDRTIGSEGEDLLASLIQTTDGSYVLAGSSSSAAGGNKSENTRGQLDYWVVKLNAAGQVIWDKTLGSGANDEARSIVATSDGGYLVGGTSNSGIGSEKTESNRGLRDFWIVKLSESGSVQWDKTLGGAGNDDLYSLYANADGNYVAGGSSNSVSGGDKTENSRGGYDFWVVKVNPDGSKVWDKTIGGNEADAIFSLQETSDQGYVLGGTSYSGAGGDKSSGYKGFSSYWIVKLAPENPLPVTLKSFSALKEGETALLAWETTLETNSDHFEIQHSLDGKDWTVLTSIHAQGESSGLNSYHYAHTAPVSGSDNLYRLKMVDADGSFAYSKIQHVEFEEGFTVSVYPNPAAETIHLKVADWSKVKGLQIFNSQGKTFYSSENKPSQDISTRSLKPGLYFIKITFTDSTESTRKVVIGQ
ncbi:T9SS type A sorting domain-containing protein [Dyadobacter sandarakinus]|uniref:T9SS type A sorting domain-containing protein n=1 Tax=Dyadobacter sandarakinus TaxID=2747268 RepID=A0ABX7I5M6_9BACT|nr:T9SS type A sorting domain-containing protein [Dyadobacter sandarakinus]QRR01396.1 T9SS type A sorting domain-containing protein [Dyadobacter sandarakinus]